jgi:N-acetylglutamate synthase
MITIRPMVIADYEDVLRLWTASEGVGLNDRDTREGIGMYLERNPAMSQVAEEGDILVGATLCGHDGRRGYLHHLAVAQSHRGHGIGRDLVHAARMALASSGIDTCHCFVFADNPGGRGFWSSAGWRQRDELVLMTARGVPR